MLFRSAKGLRVQEERKRPRKGLRREVPNNFAHEERRGVDRITDEERARNDSVDPRGKHKTRK